MGNKATATFEVKGWVEKPYAEIEGGAKFTRASVTKTFHGDIEGEGTVEYLMFYPGDGTATFIGLERVAGCIGTRSGSFVLQHTGTDDGSTANITLSIVTGSGTGNLRGIEGQGTCIASRNDPGLPMTLDYDFS